MPRLVWWLSNPNNFLFFFSCRLFNFEPGVPSTRKGFVAFQYINKHPLLSVFNVLQCFAQSEGIGHRLSSSAPWCLFHRGACWLPLGWIPPPSNYGEAQFCGVSPKCVFQVHKRTSSHLPNQHAKRNLFPGEYRVWVAVLALPNAQVCFSSSFRNSKTSPKSANCLINTFLHLQGWSSSLSSTLALTALFLPLLAREDLGPLTARVALDHAAPVELAVALPDACVVVCVVAAAAAHHTTAVGACRRPVAQAAPCARAPRGRVLFAVVGWALQVHQVCVGGLLEATHLLDPQEGGLAEARGTHGLHLDGVAVALF